MLVKEKKQLLSPIPYFDLIKYICISRVICVRYSFLLTPVFQQSAVATSWPPGPGGRRRRLPGAREGPPGRRDPGGRRRLRLRVIGAAPAGARPQAERGSS